MQKIKYFSCICHTVLFFCSKEPLILVVELGKFEYSPLTEANKDKSKTDKRNKIVNTNKQDIKMCLKMWVIVKSFHLILCIKNWMIVIKNLPYLKNLIHKQEKGRSKRKS